MVSLVIVASMFLIEVFQSSVIVRWTPRYRTGSEGPLRLQLVLLFVFQL